MKPISRKPVKTLTVNSQNWRELLKEVLDEKQNLTIKNPQKSEFEIHIFRVPEGETIPVSGSGKFSGDPEGAPETPGLLN